jgi:glycosyltransferase involved in cell wall biosynthesis
MGASSRLRTYQFLPFWEQEGYQVKVFPFFNDKYLEEKYQGKRVDRWNLLKCYFKRLWVVLGAKAYHFVWLEKEVFPFLPAWTEWLLQKSGTVYFVDYDDAVFHRYDQSRSGLIRRFLGRKIDAVMRHARVVFVGNSYLEKRALHAGAKRVVRLPTVIDMKRYGPKNWTDKKPLRIGWIGSPTTLKYMDLVRPQLEQMCKETDAEVLLVNGNISWDFDGPWSLVPWTEAGEVAAIQQMDIGLMPLPDTPWEQGKCAYKLIQYMACGLPVIASPVGMNVDVVEEGVNGFLAKDGAEWLEALRTLVRDAPLRRRMGERGFALVQKEYTVEGNFGKMRLEIENSQ